MRGDMRFRILEKKVHMTQLCEKASFQHFVTAWIFYKIKADGEDGWRDFIPLCREYSNTRAQPKAQALCAIPAGRIFGPVSEVHIVNFFDEYGIEGAIQSISNNENTSHVVISREIERFVKESQNHKTDARSSNELLENLQESEGKVTTRFKETWSTTETRADPIRLIPHKASLYARRTIPKINHSCHS